MLFVYIYILYKNVLFYRNQKIDDHTNLSTENVIKTLLVQLQKSEEENKKILKEKEILKQQNEEFNTKVTKLQAEVTKMTDRQEQADVIPVEALRKVFTAGQIAKLKSSTNSRIHWSPEDIVSAIGLRALSPKAYRYLRNVKNMSWKHYRVNPLYKIG